MLINRLRPFISPALQKAHTFRATLHILKRLETKNVSSADDFNYNSFRKQVLGFLDSLCDPECPFMYYYSKTCSQPTLYASAYACMTRSMLGDLGELDHKKRADWVRYFDSFQEERDGLFYDPVVENEIYSESDWWGARHLALHMISAYTDLNARPRFPFKFLERYYDDNIMRQWLDEFDWGSVVIGHGDLDNKIMNIGCLLQFQRDAWKDKSAGLAAENLKGYLREKLNHDIGMWGRFSPDNKHERSRMVQFAYHLFPIFFYDGDFDFDADRIVQIVLRTQNRFGGFGTQSNSSACEDIDSIDLLIRLYPYVGYQLREQINAALSRAFSWVLLNQVDDGGFVFRLNEAFQYGSAQTSSGANNGAMLPTWFRTLSIVYLCYFFDVKNQFRVTRCSGYEF